MEVLWGPKTGDPRLYEPGDGTMAVPKNPTRCSEGMEESGCCASALASVLMRGRGSWGRRLF